MSLKSELVFLYLKGSMNITRLKLGIFFLCMALLLYELTLIRVFSAVLFYHFAFLAIGISMLGIAAGGLTVHLFPQKFSREKLDQWGFFFCAFFAIAAVISMLIVFKMPVNAYLPLEDLWLKLSLIYFFTFLPFYFAGLLLATIFSNYSEIMGELYAYDLIGAGLGAILVIPLMNWIGGEAAVLIVATLAFVGSGFLSPSRVKVSIVIGLLVLFMGLTNQSFKWIKIQYTKGMLVEQLEPVFDKWNSFSRVMVIPFRLGTDAAPQTWAPSPKYTYLIPQTHSRGEKSTEFFSIMIDDGASTPVLPFDGENLDRLEFLKYDLTALGHRLKGNGTTLVIGTGGGRDVLTGLVLGANHVDAVDINPLIFKAVGGTLKEYSGNLYKHPQVQEIVSEGRAYVRKKSSEYDLIQIAMIDTWASTTAGAYALSENNLYTVEAFKDYFKALKPDGILSFTRFYFTPPREALRLISLYLETAEQLGIPEPSKNILVAMHDNLATILFKKKSFTDGEIDKFAKDVFDMGFSLIYASGYPPERHFNALINSKDRAEFFRNYQYDISPPTDNRPFFFNLLKLGDFLKAYEENQGLRFNYYATYTLVIVFVLSLVATLITLVLPLLFQGAWLEKFSGRSYLLGYFLVIGLGYLLIEIALLQRFTLMLEHPAYAASTVISGFLIASGLGSYFWGRIDEVKRLKFYNLFFVMMITFMLFHIFVSNSVVYAVMHLPIFVKFIIVMFMILPLGFTMGIPLPAGMMIAGRHSNSTVAWCWAINGAASVLASTLAMVIAMGNGFTVVLQIGLICYLIAFTLMSLLIRIDFKRSLSGAS